MDAAEHALDWDIECVSDAHYKHWMHFFVVGYQIFKNVLDILFSPNNLICILHVFCN